MTDDRLTYTAQRILSAIARSLTVALPQERRLIGSNYLAWSYCRQVTGRSRQKVQKSSRGTLWHK